MWEGVFFGSATLTHNTLCSTQPAYLHSLLNHHTPTRSLRSAYTNLLSAPRVRTTFASRGFSVAAPQSGTHSHLAFATLPLPISFVAFLKLTASSRPSAPPSDSPKCLSFGHWLILCILNVHLLTYLVYLHSNTYSLQSITCTCLKFCFPQNAPTL